VAYWTLKGRRHIWNSKLRRLKHSRAQRRRALSKSTKTASKWPFTCIVLGWKSVLRSARLLSYRYLLSIKKYAHAQLLSLSGETAHYGEVFATLLRTWGAIPPPIPYALSTGDSGEIWGKGTNMRRLLPRTGESRTNRPRIFS
jgi:hypothetical protein